MVVKKNSLSIHHKQLCKNVNGGRILLKKLNHAAYNHQVVSSPPMAQEITKKMKAISLEDEPEEVVKDREKKSKVNKKALAMLMKSLSG